MMQEHKRKSGARQAFLALLALYAAITLLPACVYGLAKNRGNMGSPPAGKTGEASNPPESVLSAESRDISELPSSAESQSAAGENAPGFLDGLSLPDPAQKPAAAGSGEEFTLYDRATGETRQITAEELLPAAIACEMDLFSPQEALKAQAIACHTLFCRKRAAGETIVCDSAAWEVWTSEEVMRERWGEDYENYMGILTSVAEEAAGQTLQFDGEPALTPYFAISGGATEASGAVWEQDLPYLQAVASPGDLFSDGFLTSASFTTEEFRDAATAYFRENPPDFSGPADAWLTELKYTPSGYVRSAVLGGKAVSGQELRNAFSLRSSCFQVEQNETGFTFTVRGWGHGVGMSQAGAVFLAKRGASCREILSHYYPGTELTGSGAA